MSAAVQQKTQLNVKLTVVKGPHAGQLFQMNKEVIKIGRGPENDIVLLNDPQVSRSHAEIVLVDRDFEIVNLSRKNAVFVNGENVDRWKLVNNQTFIIGDSEFKIEYDLGQAVASIPAQKMADVVPIKPKPPVSSTQVTQAVSQAKVPQSPVPQSSSQPGAQQKNAVAKMPPPRGPQSNLPAQNMNRPPAMPMGAPPRMNPMPGAYQAGATQAAKKESLFANPRFRFYAIVAVLIGGFLIFILSPDKKSTQKPRSTLKYEDEMNIKLNSTSEKDLVQKRFELKKERNSPQRQRTDENFMKGMRDYQLGNYSRAMEFFQVVLNLEPDHALARRHLYLSKVRFDELVQAKLMLGESYYKKHNFGMCESLYQQVMDMLGDKKTNDPKYKMAQSKTQECALAAEGIR